MKIFDYASIKDIESAEIFNQREIKKRYRKLAKKHHPDRNQNSPESHAKFQEINIALGVLLGNS